MLLLYSAVQQAQKPENTLLEYLNAILDSVIVAIITAQQNYLPSHSLFSLEISTFGDLEKKHEIPIHDPTLQPHASSFYIARITRLLKHCNSTKGVFLTEIVSDFHTSRHCCM